MGLTSVELPYIELKAMSVLLTLRPVKGHGYSKQQSDLVGNL